jgi:hypothetical protein
MRRPARKSAGKKPSKAARGTAKNPAKSSRRSAPEKQDGSVPQAYKMTQRESAIADAYWRRYDQSPPGLRFNVKQHSGHVEVRIDHADLKVGSLLLLQALGTTNPDFANGLMNQLRSALCKGKAVNAAELNQVVAMVQGIGPRDETEAMLATQMTAIHSLTMKAARQMSNVETIDQQDSASNMLNKLARTFTSQVEALKKYRSTGEQNIRVQHVNVNEGGQAIVGNVQTGGGGSRENGEQSHEPGSSLAQRPALPCDVQANETTMPSASREGEERVPLSRRARRSPKREG